MARPSKLTPQLQHKIGENIALGLPYKLAAEAGNCQVCMWILSRRFPDEFGRRVYRKTNVVSENLNQNVEIVVQDTNAIRKEILAKFAPG